MHKRMCPRSAHQDQCGWSTARAGHQRPLDGLDGRRAPGRPRGSAVTPCVLPAVLDAGGDDDPRGVHATCPPWSSASARASTAGSTSVDRRRAAASRACGAPAPSWPRTLAPRQASRRHCRPVRWLGAVHCIRSPSLPLRPVDASLEPSPALLRSGAGSAPDEVAGDAQHPGFLGQRTAPGRASQGHQVQPAGAPARPAVAAAAGVLAAPVGLDRGLGRGAHLADALDRGAGLRGDLGVDQVGAVATAAPAASCLQVDGGGM